MATVRMMLNQTDVPSKEQLQLLHDAANRTIVFDEESPEMTEEMLKKRIELKKIH